MFCRFAPAAFVLALSVSAPHFATAEPILAESDVAVLANVTTPTSAATAMSQAKAVGPKSAAYIFIGAESTDQISFALSVAISESSKNYIGDLATNPDVQAGISDLASVFNSIDSGPGTGTLPIPEPTSLVLLSIGILSLGLRQMMR